MAISNYNRIINLTFYDSTGKEVLKITTPAKGRKPNITLSALFLCCDLPQNVNVTVKNFYFSQASKTYEKLKIEAGYENNINTSITGSISYMFQENVGPEGQTVICCKLDNKYENWLDKSVELSYPTSYKLSEVLQAISTQLGYKAPKVSTDEELQEPLQFTGTCREAINTLKSRFDVTILNSFGQLIADKTGTQGNRVPIDVKILSSPPVVKSGGGNSANSIMVTMPWEPSIQVGDIISIPMNVYSTDKLVKDIAASKTKVEITSINIQFSTVSNANKMTIEGLVVS